MRTILTFLAIVIAVAVAITETVPHLGAASSTIVISQVYGGGGNSGATLKNDFIELFNRGTSSVSLGGMSVQYASAAGTSWQVTALSAVTLAPGQYYLVQEAVGTGGTVNLPTPDATGNIAMSATAGKVALVSTTTQLSGACPAGVVDLIGYNSPGANGCSEGTTTAALTNTTAAIRALGGCTDTDINVSDFAIGAPTPRNTASPSAPCGGGGDTAPSVSSTTPASGATGVALSSSISVTFSEPVTATSAAFSLACPTGVTQTVTQNPVAGTAATTITLTPSALLPTGTTCLLTVSKDGITDTDGTPDHMTADKTVTFTTTTDLPPTVTATLPANNATNVPVASNVVITFSESVNAAGAFGIECPAGSQQTFTASASPAGTFTLTPAAPFPYATICTVTVSGTQVTDIDGTPDAMVGNRTISFTTAAAPPPGAGKVIINEIDADTPGSDTAEFIELYDGGSGNTPLDGLVVVLYDGGSTPFTGNQVYAAFDLTGKSTDGNGYFVLGNPGVPNVGLTFDPGQFGLLQNGPDAVALYIGHASDFPIGTVVTTTNLLDAIVYGTDDPAPANLMPLLSNPGQLIVNEDANGAGTVESSQRCPNGMGGTRNNLAYSQAAPTPGSANTCPATAPPSDVVISQLYGGGGNSNPSYHNDFVELYNRSAASVDLSGWSIQYASSTGSGWDTNLQPLGGSIGSHQYYLISLGTGGGAGAPLPPANIVGQLNLSGTTGKVALTDSFDPLVGNCPLANPHVRDFIGYGAADCGEGATTAPSLSGNNMLALLRQGLGATDTNNNHNDFATGAPNPRQTAPIVEIGPFVLLTDPRRGEPSAPRDATIQVTFTEPVDLDPNWFDISCATTSHHTDATFAGAGKNHYITPNVNFQAGESCTVTVFKNTVHDQDLDDSGPNTDTLPADYSWSFTVATGTAPPYPPSVHLTMGNPSGANSDPDNYLMMKPEYALSYNRDLGRPNWVSWHLSDEWIGTLVRADTFRPDPQVPPDWYRVQSFDFSGSGFDRGHMTPNADRDKETSIPINQATFLMSNMVAQAPTNNEVTWAALEAALRDIVAAGNELYIVSGPAGAGGTGSNLDQNGQPFVTTTLANGHVTVPALTWKVALVLPKADGDDVSRVSCSTRTIAVIMPNSQTINADWTTYLTTVDAVETLTGYNFFSNVPEPYQRCIEAGTNGNNPPLVNGDQTITFPQPADSIYGDAPFTAGATGGASGNPVTFAASGACSSSGPNGATISILAPGSCTITASQAGSAIYNAAADVVRTLNVGRAAQTIAFAGLPDRTYGDAPFTVSAGGGASGNPVTFVASGACTSNGVSGATVQMLAAGACTVTASQAGDSNYNAAADVVQTFTVGRAALSASAADKTREYGAPDPVFTGTLTGVVAGDTITASFTATDVPTSPPGTYQIVVTLNDPGGRLGNYIVTTHNGVLTITDTTPPQLTLPANITIAETSPAGRVVNYVATASDLLDSAVSVFCAPASGSLFAVGTTTVNCSASDAHGNGASGSFTVTVTTDRRAPRITDPGRIVAEATGPAGAVVLYDASALDAHDGPVPVVCVPASGSTFPLGRTTVTCTASDISGNVATDTFPVTVRDTTDPEIVSVTPSASVLPPNGLMTPVTFSVITTDVVDPNPSCLVTRVTSNVRDVDHDGVPDWSITGPLSVSLEAATRKHKDRNYVITIKCTDASGNSSKEKTTVVVSHLP